MVDLALSFVGSTDFIAYYIINAGISLITWSINIFLKY